MIRISFAEADRQAFGIEAEYLDYDENSLRVSEVRKLQAATGLSVTQWSEGLKSGDTDAVVALVWLALARVGVQVEFAELDFDLAGLKSAKAEPSESPGKDQSTPETTSA